MLTATQQAKQQKREETTERQAGARSEVGRLIIQLFLNTNNLWATSAEVLDACSEYDKVLVRNRMQQLVLNETLEADKSGGKKAYKYRLHNPALFTPPAEFVGPMQVPELTVALTTPVAEEAKPLPEWDSRAPEHLLPEPQQVPEGKRGQKRKIVWSHDQRMVLAHEVASIREKQPFVSLGAALEMAQRECLPAELHRLPINNIKGQAPWLVDMVDLIAKTKAKTQAETAPIPEPTNEPVKLADYTIGELVDALLDKLNDRFKIGVLDIIKSQEVQGMFTSIQTQENRRHNPLPQPAVATVKKERILIAGILKPMHEQEVRDKYGKDFDLRFYHPDQSVHKLKAMAPNADRVLLMATQISHKHEDSLKTTNVKFEKIRGNIGVLLQRLSEIKTEYVH